MEKEQFHVVLPSNSSMKHFPDNTTSSFITELPHSIHLHGQWEVALSEIQFPCTFLHVRPGENKIKFYELKLDEKVIDAFTPKEIVINAGIYKNIQELILAINMACKTSLSHFELTEARGGRIRINVSCDNKCNSIHLINFPDNIIRMLGLAGDLAKKTEFFTMFEIFKANSKRLTEKVNFLKFNFPTKNDQKFKHFWASEPHSLWSGIPDKMFVYCDICEPYITGDVRTPLLRVVPVEIREHNYAYGTVLVSRFSRLNYIPVQQTNLRRIEIDIRDHLGERIPFNSGTSTAILHFKRVH